MPAKSTQHLKELQCKVCKKTLPSNEFFFHQQTGGKKYRMNTCHKCYLKNRRERRAKNKTPNEKQKSGDLQRLRKWKEKNRGTIEGFIYSNLYRWRKRSIEKCNIESNLTFDYLIDLWHSQNGNCYYLGVKLDCLQPKLNDRRQLSTIANRKFSPSLDRIIPSKGYTQGNVAWCAFAINSMKGELTGTEFIKVCNEVVLKSLKS